MNQDLPDQQHVSEGSTEDPAGEGVAEQTDGSEFTEALRDDMLDSVIFNWLPEVLKGFLDTLSHYPLLLVILLASLGYLFGKLLQFVLTQAGDRIAGRTETDYDDRLLEILRRPALATPVILSLLLVTALLPFPEVLHSGTVGFLSTLLLFSWLRAALKATHVLLEMIAAREGHSEIVQPRTIPLFEITLKVVLVTLAGYLLLLIWGINPAAWLASAGVIGIAVGFAARDTLANLFSGIFIVADAPYKIGDYIVLDTGERGEVTHLGMRSTRLLTRDDIEVTIPNAIIANAKIINESGGPWEKHRIRIPVGVAYGSDVDQVADLLKSVAGDIPEIIAYPAPRVRMRGFGTSSLNFELLGWIDKPFMRGRVTDNLLKSIYKRFRDEGITIPFPQTDVHIRDMPDSAPD